MAKFSVIPGLMTCVEGSAPKHVVVQVTDPSSTPAGMNKTNPAVAKISDNNHLFGTDAKSEAHVDQWINFTDEMLFGNAVQLFYIFNNLLQYSKSIEQFCWDRLEKGLTYLDNYLVKHTFLVGHRLTAADIAVAVELYDLFVRYLGPQARGKYTNVLRYYNTVVNQKALDGIIPVNAEFAKENAKFVPPKKEEKPKKEAAAPAPAAAAAQPAKQEKPKNPLDELPKSSFVLEEWKRVYTNEDTRSKALPWFYEHYDKDGYSIWRFDFKYNDELTQIFMSNNQIGGFFNRLEASRKYVMGTAGVFGENGNNLISGVIILRGKEYEPVLSVAPDLESYAVTPLDLEKPEDKKFFEDMLAWEAVIDGKSWADGKMLK